MAARRFNKLKPTVDVNTLRLFDDIWVSEMGVGEPRLIRINGICVFDKHPHVIWIKENNVKFHRLAHCFKVGDVDDELLKLIDEVGE